MLDTDVYTKGIRAAQNGNLSRYDNDVRGSEAILLAGDFGLANKTVKFADLTLEQEAKVRGSKKYAKGSDAEKRAMLQPKRKEGGDNGARSVRRWFASEGKQKRPLLPERFDDKNRLDLYYTGGPNPFDKDLLRVILAQCLSADGCEREADEGSKNYNHEQGFNTLSDALDFARQLEMQETENEAQGLPFGVARGWFCLKIRGGYGSWQLLIDYQVLSSDAISTMMADREDENKESSAEREKQRRGANKELRELQHTSAQEMAKEMQAGGSRLSDERLIGLLTQYGWISDAQQWADGAYTANLGTLALSWGNVARAASYGTLGGWHPRSTGLTWAAGSRVLSIMHPDALIQYRVSHGILTDLDKTVDWKGKSTAALARQALGWVMPPGRGRETAAHSHLTEGDRLGYLQCKPGNYDNMNHWDISGAYFSLAARCTSPRVQVRKDSPPRFVANTEETDRYHTLLDQIKYDKPLRNTLVGCMAAGTEPHRYWSRGVVATLDQYSTDFAPLGLLIARVGWEVCRRAAEDTNAVLAITDCVVTADETPPLIWTGFGLKVKKVATGDTVIHSPTSFKVGGRETKPYQWGDRGRLHVAGSPVPSFEYWRYLV